MKLLVIAALLATSMAFASSLSSASDYAARTLGAVELKWTGAINTSGENITLTGTAESIFNQIIALNPNYEQERDAIRSGTLRTRGLDKRDPINTASINCNVFAPATSSRILEGIDYLYRIGDGDCSAPPGSPGHGGCARVSCSYDAGIFLCNDQSFDAHIPCRIVADNANGISNTCTYTPDFGKYSVVHGQIFSFNYAWDVIIQESNC